MTKFYDRASDVVRRIYEKRIDAPAVLDAPVDFPNSRKFAAELGEDPGRGGRGQARIDAALPRHHAGAGRHLGQ